MTDLLAFLCWVFACAAIACFVLWRRALADTDEQRTQAQENWLWAELHAREATAARLRLRNLERKHQRLLELYTAMVRRHLAANTILILRNKERK